MPIKSLFPSSVSVSPLGSVRQVQKINQELLPEIEQIRRTDETGQKWSQKSYPGGYTSYATLNRLDQFSTSFLNIRNKIDLQVQKFSQHLDMDLQGRKLIMTNFWVNIMPPKTVHSMHIHPLSAISGTYYVQTPKNCSAIKFEDPRIVCFMGSPPRKTRARDDNQRFISLTPQAGQVILFESWMRHEVPPNLSRQNRISLSFNYDWI